MSIYINLLTISLFQEKALITRASKDYGEMCLLDAYHCLMAVGSFDASVRERQKNFSVQVGTRLPLPLPMPYCLCWNRGRCFFGQGFVNRRQTTSYVLLRQY